MLPKERKLISRLRRRNVIYIITILSLSYWLVCKYNDEEILNYRIEDLEYEIQENDSIQKIEDLKLDTLNIKEQPVKIEKKEEVKKEVKKQKTIQKLDTSKIIKEEVIKIETNKDTIN